MTSKTLVILLVCVAAAALSSFAGSAGAQTSPPGPAEVERARELYREGVKFAQARQFDRAVRAFRDSLRLRPHPETVRALGAAEYRNAELAAASRHFAQYLRDPAATDAKARADVEKYLKEAERSVGRLAIEAKPEGARVEVDGEVVGTAPLGFAWHVEPGRHAITVTHQGYEKQSLSEAAVAGQVTPVSVSLTRTEAPRDASTVPPADAGLAPREASTDAGANAAGDAGAVEPASDPRWTIGLVGGGLTVIALGAGTFFLFEAQSAKESEDRLSDELDAYGPSGCASNPAARAKCADYQDQVDARKSANRWGTVSFAAAGAIGVATIATVALWPASKERPRASLWTSPSGAGVALSGSF